MSNSPSNLRYTKDHEWLDPSGTAWRVGITQFAVSQLGDIVLVDIPEAGRQIEQGEPFGTIESVKSVSELYMPVSGKVTAINKALQDEPELVNEDPFGEGWLIEIEPTDKAELDPLMESDAYDKFTET
ncbi:MAG TPA: glycine cleavage system protein GcvH [Kofleriaceae bacterium]|jgi:glycine cleavage system H protein|nr:glycine cleavage system protein GcvH [Kofleriaceae bacterium]